MKFKTLVPNGPVLMIPTVHGDERGKPSGRRNLTHSAALMFLYKTITANPVKMSCAACSYQLEQPQGRPARMIQGHVCDVAVDLRASSPTFGQGFAALLEDANRYMLWVSHGFLVVSPEAEFACKCTTYYAPEDAHCLRWDDPAIGIGPSPCLTHLRLFPPKGGKDFPLPFAPNIVE